MITQIKSWPLLDKGHQEAVARVLKRGILSGADGSEVIALERELSEWLDIPYVIATGSGTSSLMIALMSLGLEKDDEVLVPAYTFGATALAVMLCGFRPKFVDIDPATFNIDVTQIESMCNERTRAIIAVHIHGLPCDLDKIISIAKRNKLAVIEDCAQSHGAKYKGQMVGTLGDFGCFSLQSSKHLGSGEGGFLVTREIALAESARSICNFGFEANANNILENEHQRDGYSVFREHIQLGGMFRLQELPAAIARTQLKQFPKHLSMLDETMEYFSNKLKSLSGISLPVSDEKRRQVWHKIRISIDTDHLAPNLPPYKVRDIFRNILQEQGIATTLWQSPILPLHKAFYQFADEIDWCNSSGQKALERSFVLFNEQHPLIAQEPSFAKSALNVFFESWDLFLKRIKQM